ncbi:MAG: hypothetical protein HY865_22075 [Chloroflexi bacterium]|nr:hypothetical protein [Chloroflexota bacterium]
MQTKIIRIDPRKLKLLEVNAHFMRHEVFMRLTENVKEDKALTSVPFCAIYQYFTADDPIQRLEDGSPQYEVLSGNHRVKSAIAADLPEIDVMVTDEPLSPDRRKAIQLSHNALVGEDDPATLKMIYGDIQDLTMRLYSGLDDKRLDMLDKVSPGALGEANLQFQPVSFMFLPDELDQVKEVWEIAKKEAGAAKLLWLARMKEYDAVMDALEATSSSYGVKNVTTSLIAILEIFTRHITDLSEGYITQDGEATKGVGAVPIASVTGVNIPAKTAALLKKVLERTRSTMPKGKTNIDALHQLLEQFSDGLNVKS